ncbi:hypothetical protein Nmel_004496 [Mimus melanotis]
MMVTQVAVVVENLRCRRAKVSGRVTEETTKQPWEKPYARVCGKD